MLFLFSQVFGCSVFRDLVVIIIGGVNNLVTFSILSINTKNISSCLYGSRTTNLIHFSCVSGFSETKPTVQGRSGNLYSLQFGANSLTFSTLSTFIASDSICNGLFNSFSYIKTQWGIEIDLLWSSGAMFIMWP
jgi:hypothetical protein